MSSKYFYITNCFAYFWLVQEQQTTNTVKIDSITRSFCLHHYVQNGLSYSGKETRLKLCKPTPSAKTASDLPTQINSSCYTDYRACGLSLIYNTVIQIFKNLNVKSN